MNLLTQKANNNQSLTFGTLTNLCLIFPLLLATLLFLFLQVLFVLSHQCHQVRYILVCLGQQIGKTLVLLLVNQLPVTFFIFFLETKVSGSNEEMIIVNTCTLELIQYIKQMYLP